MPEPAPPAEIVQDDMDTQSGPQLIRITNHGKMNTWVAFALDFLEVCLSLNRSILVCFNSLSRKTKKDLLFYIRYQHQHRPPPIFKLQDLHALLQHLQLLRQQFPG
jgi:hypothetical protein